MVATLIGSKTNYSRSSQNKGYDVIISVREIIVNKVSSGSSSCIVDVVMWLKFGNPSISIKGVIITSIL